MADTNLRIMDDGLKNLLFTRYQDIIGLTDIELDLVNYPKDVALRHIAEKRGNDSLEFISFWRTASRRDPVREKTPLARRGLSLQFDDGDQSAIQTVKTMPVSLEYDIHFWTKKKEVLNAITEKAIFWKHQDPNLNLSFEGAGEFALEYDMHFGDIEDESPIARKNEEGLYFVAKLKVTIDGWVFDEVQLIKTIQKIFLKVYQDVDPGGPEEKSILLFSVEEDYTE